MSTEVEWIKEVSPRWTIRAGMECGTSFRTIFRRGLMPRNIPKRYDEETGTSSSGFAFGPVMFFWGHEVSFIPVYKN